VDDIALIVPVRSFTSGKSRLADRLAPAERAILARSLADIVVDPDHRIPTYVVCDDPAIAEWSTSRAARPILVGARGLNESLTAARPEILAHSSAKRFAIIHADLPLAHRLAEDLRALSSTTFDEHGVVIVTDAESDGTNVLVLPRSVLQEWEFAYGPDSCSAHRSQAESRGLVVNVIGSGNLSLDLDTARDLDDPRLRTILDSLLPGRNN
jgi:2-phospho-L-lactate guanylyltransferase